MHLKFRGGVFEVIAGARVVPPIEKIVHRIDGHADVNGVRFEPHRFGGCHQAVSFRSPRLRPDPVSGRARIAREPDRITSGGLREHVPRRLFLTIQKGFDELRNMLGPAGLGRLYQRIACAWWACP